MTAPAATTTTSLSMLKVSYLLYQLWSALQGFSRLVRHSNLLFAFENDHGGGFFCFDIQLPYSGIVLLAKTYYLVLTKIFLCLTYWFAGSFSNYAKEISRALSLSRR